MRCMSYYVLIILLVDYFVYFIYLIFIMIMSFYYGYVYYDCDYHYHYCYHYNSIIMCFILITNFVRIIFIMLSYLFQLLLF